MSQDILGYRFGRLVVSAYAGVKQRSVRSNKRTSYWVCQCDCGQIREVRVQDLKSGNSRSCGCAQREKARNRFLTHGQSKSQTYKLWLQMKQRCYNPNDDKFPDYGARGITVCPQWRNNYEAFMRDMGPRPRGYSIDRIDNDGNYEPSNCRWVSNHTQSRNKRTNVWIEHDGKRMVASDFAALMGVSSKPLYKLMSRGMDAHSACQHISAHKRI